MFDRITPHEMAVVRDSYNRVAKRSPALTHAFFTRLFEHVPALQGVFPVADTDKRAFAASFFRFVVMHLRSDEALHVLLEQFGERGLLDHVSIAQIDAIGLSMLGALRELEGTSWTVETSSAWEHAYTWTWSTIRHGARARPEQPLT